MAKPPANTGHLFARKPAISKHEITSERLDADILAFEAAGGVIERLGTTCTLQRLGEAPPDVPMPARTPAKTRR